MSELKRYNPVIEEDCDFPFGKVVVMREAECGSYIIFSDYEALRVRLTEVEAKAKMTTEDITDKIKHTARLEAFIKDHLSRYVTQDLIVDALRKNTKAEELLEIENANLRKSLAEALTKLEEK